VDRDSARAQLDAAVRERDLIKSTYDAADAALRRAITDADAAGLAHTEIAERTGVSPQLRPADRRRSRMSGYLDGIGGDRRERSSGQDRWFLGRRLAIFLVAQC